MQFANELSQEKRSPAQYDGFNTVTQSKKALTVQPEKNYKRPLLNASQALGSLFPEWLIGATNKKRSYLTIGFKTW
jgi:hypothetical protein